MAQVKTIIERLSALVMIATLIGCSGGGGGSSPDPNQRPIAVFTVNPDNGYAPLQVTLDASGSSDPDGQIVAYQWDLGNGATATGSQTTVLYSEASQYTISLTVVDDDGLDSETAATQIIDVIANFAPESTINEPVFDPVMQVGDSITFLGSATDPENNTPFTFLWDFGEGSGIAPITRQDPGPVQFNTPGTFSVTFTATDSLGLSDPTPATVIVTVQSSSPLSRSGWSATTDSEELAASDPDEGPVAYVLDGNAASIWHTEYQIEPSPGYPHHIEVDMGGLRDIHGFRALPRQDSDVNGRIIEFEFYACQSGAFSNPAIVVGSFNDESDIQEFLFPKVRARYVKLVAFSETKGSIWSTMSEFYVLGESISANEPPNGTIDAPARDITISVGDSVTFSGSGNDPDGTLPLNFYWSFGSTSGIGNSQLEDPGAVQFNVPGTYEVQFTVIDNGGQWDPTPASRIVKVLDTAEDPLLSQSNWSLLYADSEEDSTFNGFSTNAFDGDADTFWLTEYTPGPDDPGLPHEIQIDLGSAFKIDGLRYLPRQDSSDGRIEVYEVYVSPDGVNWDQSIAFGQFQNDATEKQLMFSPMFGQFVRLVARQEVDSQNWTSAAEINVEAKCADPYVHMIYPLDLDLNDSTNLTVSAAVCLSSSYPGYGVKFKIDGGVQESIIIAPPWETTFSGLSRTEHSVEAVIVDNQGAELSGVSTSHSSQTVGIGDYYVAIGDSITVGLDDDIGSDDISLDGRNKEGGYTSVLNDLLTQAKGYPHTVVMEAVSGHTTIDALTYLPKVLQKHPGAEYYLLLYGTNDSGGSIQLPTAVFKSNMQQLIDLIHNAGKEAYLAKIPYTKSPDPNRNPRIQAYNVAIDELVTENNISVTPPDFFTYFEANQNEMSDTDNLHLNGTGYRSMAALWRDAL